MRSATSIENARDVAEATDSPISLTGAGGRGYRIVADRRRRKAVQAPAAPANSIAQLDGSGTLNGSMLDHGPGSLCLEFQLADPCRRTTGLNESNAWS